MCILPDILLYFTIVTIFFDIKFLHKSFEYVSTGESFTRLSHEYSDRQSSETSAVDGHVYAFAVGQDFKENRFCRGKMENRSTDKKCR